MDRDKPLECGGPTPLFLVFVVGREFPRNDQLTKRHRAPHFKGLSQFDWDSSDGGALEFKRSGTIRAMPEYLDIENWARRDLFEFFRHYTNPYFNICTRLDITEASAHIRSQPSISISLALHYVALRAANETEPFRYRLEKGKVVIYEVVHGGTIVLQPNESFNFAYFDYQEDFGKFIAAAQQSVDEASRVSRPLQPDPSENRLHFTVLPWLRFTSFAHARNFGLEESIPKIAFGKFIKENERALVPFSVEVHHALMDGLHVGRYVERVQELLDSPETTFRNSA